MKINELFTPKTKQKPRTSVLTLKNNSGEQFMFQPMTGNIVHDGEVIGVMKVQDGYVNTYFPDGDIADSTSEDEIQQSTKAQAQWAVSALTESKK